MSIHTQDKPCSDLGRVLVLNDPAIGRVFMHPSSVNLPVGKYESPWLVYSERVETARVYVRDNTMAGGVLRTSTRPTLIILLLLRASV